MVLDTSILTDVLGPNFKLKWYHKLKSPGLLDQESIVPGNIIICKQVNYVHPKTKETKIGHQFAKFESPVHLWAWTFLQHPRDRTCFECILYQQKPHFDIDIVDTPEVASAIKDQVISNIISVLANHNVHITDRDIMITNSHGPNKRSYHITVNKYCHSNHKEAKAFYDLVLSMNPSNLEKWDTKIVDNSVYKSKQQFRLLHHTKLSANRHKTIDPQTDCQLQGAHNDNLKSLRYFELSLVSFVNECSLLPSFIPNTVHHRLNLYKDVDLTTRERLLTNAIDVFNESNIRGYEIGEELETEIGFRLNRSFPSMCCVHQRVHENENAKLIIYPNFAVKFVCYRTDAKKNYSFLRHASDITQDDTNEVEAIIVDNYSELKLGDKIIRHYDSGKVVTLYINDDDNMPKSGGTPISQSGMNHEQSFQGIYNTNVIQCPVYPVGEDSVDAGVTFCATSQNNLGTLEEGNLSKEGFFSSETSDKSGGTPIPQSEINNVTHSFEENENPETKILRVFVDNFVQADVYCYIDIVDFTREYNKLRLHSDLDEVIPDRVSKLMREEFPSMITTRKRINSKIRRIYQGYRLYNLHTIIPVALIPFMRGTVAPNVPLDPTLPTVPEMPPVPLDLTLPTSPMKLIVPAMPPVPLDLTLPTAPMKLIVPAMPGREKEPTGPLTVEEEFAKELHDLNELDGIGQFIRDKLKDTSNSTVTVTKAYRCYKEYRQYCQWCMLGGTKTCESCATRQISTKRNFITRLASLGCIIKPIGEAQDNLYIMDKSLRGEYNYPKIWKHWTDPYRIGWQNGPHPHDETIMPKWNNVEIRYFNQQTLPPIRKMVNKQKEFVLCVRAGCGVGKTRVLEPHIIKMVMENRNARILIVTNRVSVSNKYLNEYRHMGFRDYQDFQGPIIENVNRLVIQVNSLHKIVSDQEYDLVVLDEYVSIDAMLYNHVKEKKACYTMLSHLINNTKQVYICDALLDNKYIQNLKRITKRKIIVQQNLYKMHTNKRVIHCEKKTDVAMKIIQTLKKGETCAIPVGTKSLADYFELYIKRECPDKKIIKHTADTDHGDVDVTTLWSKYDVIIYSPTITCGNSYVEAIDNIFAVFNRGTCNHKCALQMIMRCRNVRTGNIYVCLDNEGGFRNKLPAFVGSSFFEIKKYLLGRNLLTKVLSVSQENPLTKEINPDCPYFNGYVGLISNVTHLLKCMNLS